MSDFVLSADFRDDQGKGASRRLRRTGKVPAIVYGGGKPPRAITLDHDALVHQMSNPAFYSSVLTLKVGDVEQAAIVKDLQRHPAKRRVMHMDLQRIVADQEIRMSVPLSFVNEDQAPGAKEGGTISHTVNEVEVLCLPRFLPESIEVDVAEVELDGSIKLSEITLPEGVRFATPPTEDNDPSILSIHVVKVVAIEEE
ncbi:MAG: 50S ribosomal protein L25/general stress protein Ctc, partial [Chromatiales bacterium]